GLADLNGSLGYLDADGVPRDNYAGDVTLTEALRLHNGEIHPASANRWLYTCVIQTGGGGQAVVAAFAENLDTGLDMGMVYNAVIDDFVPFEGYLGVTGGTGGANQNSIIHSIRVTDETPCLLPPAAVSRSYDAVRVAQDFCGGEALEGDEVPVEISINSVRGDENGCNAPAELTIVETLPEGWSATNISDGGSLAGNEVTWTIDAAVGTLTYDAVAGPKGSATITGVVRNAANADDRVATGNTSIVVGDLPETCEAEEFADNFIDDPLGPFEVELDGDGNVTESSGGWLFNGVSSWIEPGSPVCVDQAAANAHMDAITGEICSVYDEADIDDLDEFGGYVLVTAGINSQSGAVWRNEPALYNNFQLEIIVELRDGALNRPADGMTVVVLGSQDPPPLGAGGGAMGATGLGNVPQMIFEFDDWSCNGGDNNDQNHVGFAWSADGFPAVDAIPMDVFVPIDENSTPLHNKEAHPASANRYKMTVITQGGVVACSLEAIDLGIDLGTLYNFTIPDFTPFNGYLGVTASTGGANQNHILHDARLITLEDVCILPAATLTRSFEGTLPGDAADCGKQFDDGDVLTATISVDALREAADAEDPCQTPEAVRITETPPAGFTVDEGSISNGGTLADGTITWDLDAISVGDTLTYAVTAASSPETDVVRFAGSIIDLDGGQARAFGQGTVGGMTSLSAGNGFDARCGGVKCWNTLGPYYVAWVVEQGVGNENAAPGEDNIRLDYLSDGDVTELDFPWGPGQTVDTDFAVQGDPLSADSASSGIISYTVDVDGVAQDINPDGVPTVLAVVDGDSFLNLNDDVYTNDPNQVMSYTQFYVTNNTDDDVEAFFGIGSDDSVQAFLNGEEFWINNVARGGADSCSPQDIGFDPIFLAPGQNSIVMKTFEGGGGFNCSITFQNLFGRPISITEPGTLSISLGESVAVEICDNGVDDDGDGDIDAADSDCAPDGTAFVRGDPDASGATNITDGIFILNFLFLGGAGSTCTASADADGSGAVNITDGIFVLNFLFLGGIAPPAPYPDCAVAAEADCESFAACP
ncbi:MAG: Ig-like domain-containing protein, partial [Planctomycetota bacterium]